MGGPTHKISWINLNLGRKNPLHFSHASTLEVFYIMHCVVLSYFPKICDWSLNLSRDHIALNQGIIEMSKWSLSLRSPNDLFSSLHSPLSWSNGFCIGKGKRDSLSLQKSGIMAQKYYFNSSSPSPSSCFGYIWENQHVHFWVHGHPSRTTFSFT
jgi:hypothetical protein